MEDCHLCVCFVPLTVNEHFEVCAVELDGLDVAPLDVAVEDAAVGVVEGEADDVLHVRLVEDGLQRRVHVLVVLHLDAGDCRHLRVQQERVVVCGEHHHRNQHRI